MANNFEGVGIPVEDIEVGTTSLIIGMGSCGTQVIKKLAKNRLFDNCILYTIDSDLNTLNIQDECPGVNIIPIKVDEMDGSGRNRPRGKELFEEAVKNGHLDELYKLAETVKYPIIVITSTAGGTGSGAIPVLCQTLINKNEAYVNPIIVTPDSQEDNHSHRNNNQLFIDLEEAGVSRYIQFVNPPHMAHYDPINNSIMKCIEWVLGKHYHPTDLNSIDDADLDMLLNGPKGRIMVLSAEGKDITTASRALEKQLISGYQPTFTKEDLDNEEDCTLVVGFAIESLNADEEFVEGFKSIRNRISPPGEDKTYIDNEYRHICVNDNNGNVTLSVMISGLPRPPVKQVMGAVGTVKGLSEGLKDSVNPAFMKTGSTIRRRSNTDIKKPGSGKVTMKSVDEIKGGDKKE